MVTESPNATLLDAMETARREEIEREARRRELMATIARHRWQIAKHHHRLETGEALDFGKYPYQPAIYQDDALEMVVLGSVQWGKSLPNDARVHTPQGWRRNGDLQVGDRVSTPFGADAAITGVFPQGKVPIYRISFEDGRTVEACGEHLWEVWRRQYKAPKARNPMVARCVRTEWLPEKEAQVITTQQIREILTTTQDKLSVILPQPVEQPVQILPLDPYLLGLLLGDGGLTRRQISFTKPDRQLHEAIQSLLPAGLELVHYDSDHSCNYKVRSEGGKCSHDNPLADALEALGLLGATTFTKFIPERYKRGSVEQRLALLQGLMDTDGSGGKNVIFASSSERLAKDVQELVWSLGGIAKIITQIPTYTYKGEKRNGKLSYRVLIRHPRPRSLFRLQRKREVTVEEHRRAEGLKLRIVGVDLVGEKEAQCIMIDHPRHLYLAEGFVPTHNSEFLITSAAAMAACGLRVYYVLSKYDKRNKFVTSRITPAFREIPLYAAMLKAARDRSAEADSTCFKHFGPGSINFVGSNSDKDFTTYSADSAIIDEHQECVLENINRVDGRMSGSPWRYKIICGNPRLIGSEENQNLDWEYQNTDRRQWHVPCAYCGTYQVLGWWSHVIREEKNRQGAIVSITPRDPNYQSGSVLDMRAICTNCNRPMNRLSREGQWVAQNPGHVRHGYQLSNLYNVNVRLDRMFSMYRVALHDPSSMADFVNNWLGLAWNMEGSSITERMLEQASRGDVAGVDPYRFIPSSQLLWEAA